MEQPLALGDVKRGFAVLVERAQPDMIRTDFAQRDPVAFHYTNDVRGFLDLVEVRIHRSVSR